MERLHPTNAIGPHLEQVRHPMLVARLVSVAESIGEALSRLADLDLEAYELDPQLDKNLAIWPTLKPFATECLGAAQQAASETLRCFPRNHSSSEDLVDLELDLALDDLEYEVPSPIRDSHELRLDQMLKQIRTGQAGTIPGPLAETANLLEKVVLEHLGRLDSPYLREDSQALLYELHELLCRAENTLDTMVALMLVGLTESPLERTFPHFMTGEARALRLRAWAADFRFELEYVLAKAGHPDLVFQGMVVEQVQHIIGTATRRPEFQWLRSADRAEIQSFRRWILCLDPFAPLEIRRRFGLLTRWCQRMCRINDRKALVEHDRKVVELALSLLNQSIVGAPVLAAVKTLYGRSPSLDHLLREIRTGHPPRYLALGEELETMEQELHEKAAPSEACDPGPS